MRCLSMIVISICMHNLSQAIRPEIGHKVMGQSPMLLAPKDILMSYVGR